AALELIFARPLSAERQAAFDRYCREEGAGLRDFATWLTIAEQHGERWHQWPTELRDPGSVAVAAYRHSHEQRLRWYCWLQWLMDEQRQRLQSVATNAGMAVGIIHDLAVGVHPQGADSWALQAVLAQGVTVGAPPDMYNQAGQNWSQPPWRPDALADAAFIPYRDMLRSVLRHAGGLRIDHALGMFRMWWIPDGAPASAGTYVRFDHDALLGICCLEAQRAGAIVIGEDLGTLEPWVQQALSDRGLLGTSILWFESDGAPDQPCHPRDPLHWRRDVLASVAVHDLPPTAGYLRNEHVRLRHELGLLTRPLDVELAAAEVERRAWARLLVDRGWLPVHAQQLVDDEQLAAMVVALHRALAASPARLIGIALPDLVGDRWAQNQPGTDQEYPNWRVPLRDSAGRIVRLDELSVLDRAPDEMAAPLHHLLDVVAGAAVPSPQAVY
ncbi:MAG: 4-alpha-glucanotransferase, partial [Actinomycetales bacterium]